jgi:lipopolysaccharide cholinephosphotransferase
MKVRMNGSRFSESTFKHIDMHQGIFVDIFPFDKVPRQKWLERLQHKVVFFLNGLFIAKEIWQWKHCGRCDIPEPRKRGWLPCFFTRLLISLLGKRVIYKMMYGVQTIFNGRNLNEVKNIITRSEHLPIADIEQTQTVTLGPLQVEAPRDLLLYLNNHYGSVRKDIPDEMKVSHRPEELVLPERL